MTTEQTLSTQHESAFSLGFGAILVDWDGCIAIGNRPRREAIAFLKLYQAKVAIVSNNSTEFPEDFSTILARRGVRIPPERILLAGVEAIRVAASRPNRRCLILGSVKHARLAARLGITVVRENADVVVLLRDTRFTYRKLEKAVNALLGGAQLIVANPDAVHPGQGEMVVPETGSLLAAIEACVDLSKVTMKIIGKPRAPLFLKACDTFNVAPSSALMVGDNLSTDIAGAQALGMATLRVDRSFDFSARAVAASVTPPPKAVTSNSRASSN